MRHAVEPQRHCTHGGDSANAYLALYPQQQRYADSADDKKRTHYLIDGFEAGNQTHLTMHRF